MNVSTGRFISQDTYEGRKKSPLSLNKYLYGNGNPVDNIDPSGYTSLKSLTGAVFVASVIATLAINYFVTTTTLDNIGTAGGISNIDGGLFSLRGNTGYYGGTIGGGLDVFVSSTGQFYYSYEYEYGLNPATLTRDIKGSCTSNAFLGCGISAGLVWGTRGDVQTLAGSGVTASYPVSALPILGRTLINKKVYSELAYFANYLAVKGNRSTGSNVSISFGVSASGPAIIQFGLRSTVLSTLNTVNSEFRPLEELPFNVSSSIKSTLTSFVNAGRSKQALAESINQIIR